MRMFLLISESEARCGGVTVGMPVVERVDVSAYRFSVPEIQKFFLTATTGDVFQLQDNEYIVALGTVQKASWFR